MSYILLQLRGNCVEQIGCSMTGIIFSPSEGMLRRCGKLFLVAASEIPAGASIGVQLVPVSGSDEPQPVATATTGQLERELVIVQEYSNGCGGKRWPAFRVEFGSEVRVLRQDQTGGGSGSEAWTLVSAPIGWAANIAGQFRNERDISSQTIAYRPDWVPPAVVRPEEQDMSVDVSRPTTAPAQTKSPPNTSSGGLGTNLGDLLSGLKIKE